MEQVLGETWYKAPNNLRGQPDGQHDKGVKNLTLKLVRYIHVLGVILLSDLRILEEIRKGRIVIDPFDERNLGTNSYDVKLGNFFYFPNPTWNDVVFDPLSEKSVSGFWMPKHYDDGEQVTIEPRTTVLCHTREIIGGKDGITAILRARSSVVRCGLSMINGAGVGDVGYINRWAFPLTNGNPCSTTVRVGMRIGQMLFYDVGSTQRPYAGKYVRQPTWDSKTILPRLWEDREFAEHRRRS